MLDITCVYVFPWRGAQHNEESQCADEVQLAVLLEHAHGLQKAFTPVFANWYPAIQCTI